MATFSFGRSSHPAARFRVRRGDRDLGDFSLQELAAAMEAGQFLPTDELRAEGSDKWVPVSDAIQRSLTKTVRAAELLNRLFVPTPPLGSATAARLGCLGSGFLGVAGLVSGGGLLAIIIVVAFVWGTLEVNRSAAQEQQVAALRDKIVRYVDAHPQFGATTPLEMEQCPGLDDADRKLVRSLKLQLSPVDASSPPESVVITRPRPDGQRMYYKNGNNDFVMRWRAPAGGDVAVESSPLRLPPPQQGRIVRVLRDGQAIAEYTSDALVITTIWRGDGRFVAINERGPDRTRVTVIAVGSDAAETNSAPDSIVPAALFEPQDVDGSGLEVRWLSDEVTARRWVGSGELEVESFGSITVIGADGSPARYVTVRQRFRLAISEDAAMSVVGSDPPQFHRSVPQDPVN
jgi:hypothetical protein